MQAAIEFPTYLTPEVFTLPIFGYEFALRWYALAYIVGLVVGWRLIAALMRHPALWPGERAPMAPEKVDDLLTAVVIGVILGGRLGFVAFYQPAYYLENPGEILKVWQGGMSFHGGFLGVVAAGLWTVWRERVAALRLADALALATPVGLLLGRLANFVNAELWGRPSTLPWAVVFPGDAAQNCPGVLGPCARHPSQLYEAGLEGLALGLILFLLLAAGALKRPGLITGTFLAGYALSRFVVEFFRQADAQFVTAGNPMGHVLQTGGFGLSMGQLLSLPMLAAGLWLVLRARRAP